MIEVEIRNQTAVVTLGREAALNSLTLEMVRQLHGILLLLMGDPKIALIVLRGKGPKAFCAGGDVKAVSQAWQSGDHQYAKDFFRLEYAVDRLIHESPKPIVAIGHGIVMGGGLGLLAGASLRVVTETSVLAMPEIAIGLFPDVGGSFFLNKMPRKAGLFAALTGARFNAVDALDVGLADAMIPSDRTDEFVSTLSDTRWSGPGSADLERLRLIASRLECDVKQPAPQINPIWPTIEQALAPNAPLEVFRNLAALASHPNVWLAKSAAAFVKGSPTSAHLIFEQLTRGRGLTLEQCFAMELGLALQCCAGHDFHEGVRAVLIDKDHSPRWGFKTWEDVPHALIEDHFATRSRPASPAR